MLRYQENHRCGSKQPLYLPCLLPQDTQVERGFSAVPTRSGDEGAQYPTVTSLQGSKSPSDIRVAVRKRDLDTISGLIKPENVGKRTKSVHVTDDSDELLSTNDGQRTELVFRE